MSAKRSLWALIGKILWTILSLVLKVAATLGSRWARKRLDEHQKKRTRHPLRERVLHRTGG